MKNWKLFPKNINVAKYVECYWFLEKEPHDIGSNFPKLNPDPSAQLIITSPDYKFQYDQDVTCQKGSGHHWIFPHRKTFTMDHSNSFRIMGVKFKVGALYSLMKPLPNIELERIERIESVELNELFGCEVLFDEKFFENAAISSQQVCDQLDKLLAPLLLKTQEDKHSELVKQILPLLGKTAIAQLGSVLHRSQRTVERSFLRVTDLTLKQYQSMIRLEEMLNYLYKLNDEDIDWVSLAAEFEFSDQPHLIRHLKKTIGKTPGEYARQRDLTIDIYGDFEFN